MLSSIQQQAAEGAIPPADLARIMSLVANNQKELAEAVEQVQKEAQERQAKQVEAMSAEAQPGLAQPGMGAEAMPMGANAEAAAAPDLGALLGAL